MYTESKCGVKINTKRTRYLSQERGVRQGCCLSPTLFNIYINELALSLERSAAPGLTLHDSQIRCLLYADDLVLLSPTKHGLQQNLDLLEQYCQSWALTVNLKKTNIMIFQKRSRSQGTEHIFTLGTNQITHTSHYNYLGLKITSTGNFNHAVNELRDKARRAFYAINRQCPIEIPIRIRAVRLIEIEIKSRFEIARFLNRFIARFFLHPAPTSRSMLSELIRMLRA